MCLGKGATGEVYYGMREDGVSVAVKSININKVTEPIEKQIKNEITNLKTLSSPFIVKFYDCFRDK
jgi:serine/threonine protein kinase